MKRPFASKRPIGPILTRGNSFSQEDSFDIETYVRRLERAGAEVLRFQFQRTLEIYTIDITTVGGFRQKFFPGGIEIDRDGRLELAQLRLPTFTVEPNQKGLTGPEFDSVQESLTVDKWEEMNNDLGEIVSDVTGAEFEFGVVQDDNMVIRAQHGFGNNAITPHVEFLRTADGFAPIDRDELIQVISEINDMWQEKYFNLKTVSRT